MEGRVKLGMRFSLKRYSCLLLYVSLLTFSVVPFRAFLTALMFPHPLRGQHPVGALCFGCLLEDPKPLH